MKTLRLTRAESSACANGERRFWRSMKPQPVEIEPGLWNWHGHIPGASISTTFDVHSIGRRTELLPFCPYGKPGDRIWLKFTESTTLGGYTIAAITVEQRGGKWGWVVEVGA